MPAPDPNAPATQRLIAKLSPGENPFRVAIEPPTWARELDCIDIVRRLVDESGGECVLGWALWEWPGVILEGEFHAIWKKPDGMFVDVTPRKNGDTFVLFLPDPKAVVDTWQKDNVRMPLAQRREILDFIEIKERLHRAKNRAEEANSMFYTHTPHLDFLLSQEAKIFRRFVARFGPPPTR
jgi:hypothetical protein